MTAGYLPMDRAFLRRSLGLTIPPSLLARADGLLD
jgi:hypothetical protein